MNNFHFLISFIQDLYGTKEPIPLHAPVFMGKEHAYLADAVNSTFVSSIGAYVSQFETNIAKFTNSPSAIVTVNGTSALHTALVLAGVTHDDYVLTQALSFVATANAIKYCNADPVFIDVDLETLGLSPLMVEAWLDENAYIDDNQQCRKKSDHRAIKACIPMHTFGHPVNMHKLLEVCDRWRICIIEDAAESLGSFYAGVHTGTMGRFGILSFNGNKIITTGGGGMILTNQELGRQAKHLTTTAKLQHPYEFYHDRLGFNYRMPNINAALGCAQLENLELFINNKRKIAQCYAEFFRNNPGLQFISEPQNCRSNYWLNAVICNHREERDALLRVTNSAGIMTRPIWQTLDCLPMFQLSACGVLTNTKWLAERVVNLPSSTTLKQRA